jgi:hypothetical protein
VAPYCNNSLFLGYLGLLEAIICDRRRPTGTSAQSLIFSRTADDTDANEELRASAIRHLKAAVDLDPDNSVFLFRVVQVHVSET